MEIPKNEGMNDNFYSSMVVFGGFSFASFVCEVCDSDSTFRDTLQL